MPAVKRDVTKIVEQLKVVRMERGITYQKIVDETEKMGEPVSMGSVRRVFSDSTVAEFRWDTIRPIARVVLGIDNDEEFNPSECRSYYSEVEAMRSIIELKNEMLDDAHKKIEFLKETVDRERKTNKGLRVALAISCILLIACALELFGILI